MPSERWQQIKELHDALIPLSENERKAALDVACRNDPELRREVESLLAYEKRAANFMESPAYQVLAEELGRHETQASSSRSETLVGQTVSHYHIVEKLGAGGMGVVYKAEDSRLHRFVALKFLPEELASDPQALSRFRREAQAASALNHPNICTIHDVSDEGGRAFIAMEFLNGQTLRRMMSGRPFEVEQLLKIGSEVADALDAAHQTGIIHRDIKPENIFINSRGDAKVLDFGLAKVQRHNGSSSDAPTITGGDKVTEQGVAIGTVAYMSPEQAKGEILDTRTDLFSLGLVLYEMATGKRAFAGATSAIVFASLLKERPQPASELNPAIPTQLELVIGKALAKERALRYSSAAIMRSDLLRVRKDQKGGPAVPVVSPLRGVADTESLPAIAGMGVRRWLTLSAIILFVCLLATVFFWRRESSSAGSAIVEYTQLTNFADSVTSPALSPDGRMLAMIRGQESFMGTGDVYLKLLPDGDPVQLTHDDSRKLGLAFSPDGSRIAYTRAVGWDWQTWTVPVLGGEPSELLPNASGLTWISRKQVMFSEMTKDTPMSLVTASESRADERTIYTPAEKHMAHRSYLSPDAKWILAVEMDTEGWTPCRLVPLAGGSEGREVGPGAAECTEAAWSPDGRWMYFAANAGGGYHLWRQKFPSGRPEQITFAATEERGIAVSPDGRSLVTSVGSQQSTVWVHTRKGDQQVSSQGFAYLPYLSANGEKLYYLVRTNPNKFVTGELWSAELSTGHKEKLFPGISISRYSVSPDDQTLVFTRNDGGHSSLWLSPLDRHSPPKQLVAGETDDPMFTSDREIFFVREEGGAKHVFRMKADGSDAQKVIPEDIHSLLAVSPDHRVIVVAIYSGDPKQPQTLFAYPVDGGAPRILCRVCGIGTLEQIWAPLVNWSRDQKAMYVSTDKTYVIPLNGRALPTSLPRNLNDDQAWMKKPGIRVMDTPCVFPGPDPSMYSFCKVSTQRNLYRLSLP